MATRCPACKETIKPTALKCRHCLHELTEQQRAKNKSRGEIETAVKLFVVFLLFVAITQCISAAPDRPYSSVQTGPGPDQDPLSVAGAETRIQVDTSERYVERSAMAECRTRYPSDYTMRAACTRNHRRGASSFAEIWNANLNNPAMLRALEDCFERYTSDGVTEFSILGGCARNQQRGLEEVGP